MSPQESTHESSPEYVDLVRGLWDVLKSSEFKVDALARLHDARAFYDGHGGLRIVVVTCAYWAEAWIHSPTVRRACIHTTFLERGVTFEWDCARHEGRVIGEDDWPRALDPSKFC